MGIEKPPLFKESTKLAQIEEFSNTVNVEKELINKVDKYTVQPWVELLDMEEGKTVRMRVVNNGESPEAMIQRYEGAKKIDSVKYASVRLEIDEQGRHRVYFIYLKIKGSSDLQTQLHQRELLIIDNCKDESNLPGNYRFTDEEFESITKELSYVCMDTLPMVDININGVKVTCIGLTKRANKPGVVYANKFWLWGGRIKPKRTILAGGKDTFKRETKLSPEDERFEYITTYLARYNNPDTPDKPYKTTVNVTYSLKLTQEEASSIELDLNEYAEPIISWIPIYDLVKFTTYTDNFHFKDSNKYDKLFTKLLAIRQQPKLPKYNLNGEKLGYMDINPLDPDYIPLFTIFNQLITQKVQQNSLIN